MKRLLDFVKNYFSSILTALYFLAAIAITVLVLPREGKFRYEFQKGKPWMHDDLVAPFDFSIYKTDAELIRERNEILNNFKPVFHYDNTTVEHVLAEFHADFNTDWSLSPSVTNQPNERLINEVENTIRLIHRKGIIQPDDTPEIRHRLFSGISLLEGNHITEMPFEELFTVNKAQAELKEKINGFKERGSEETRRVLNQMSLYKYTKPNLTYNSQLSNRIQDDMLANLSITEGLVFSGERIVSKGEIIDTRLYQILHSLKREYESRVQIIGSRNLVLLGYILLISIIYLMLFLFLLIFRRDILQFDSKILFILMLVVTMSSIALLLMKQNMLSIYIIPFAVVPIFIRTFYDSRLALFVHLTTIFIIGFFAPNSFEFVFIQFIAGIVAIYSLDKVYRRGKLFLSVAFILLTYLVVYSTIGLIQDGSFQKLTAHSLVWFTGNALLLLASYQLIYLFEKIFGFLSDTTLMELSDTNQDLLRSLAEFAPGTFQHSLQVSSLAESAIQKIGGNPLLVRAGALYHDIGKLNNPYYFIENQSSVFNPHDSLSYEESAAKIIGHVTDGVQIAKKHRLPEPIIDFIRTHHGTTKVQYFYRLFKNKFPDAKEEFDAFSYPGPKPYSKETAVVMMADSVEAASRALKTITIDTLDNLVEGIIDYQQEERQFTEANITFKDITEIKQIFKKKLQNIYHARIEYPKEESEQ